MASERWEYCAVYWRFDPPKVVFYSVQGEKAVAIGEGRKKPDPGDRGRTYAQLGSDGWELTSVDGGDWYFKRRAGERPAI